MFVCFVCFPSVGNSCGAPVCVRVCVCARQTRAVWNVNMHPVIIKSALRSSGCVRNLHGSSGHCADDLHYLMKAITMAAKKPWKSRRRKRDPPRLGTKRIQRRRERRMLFFSSARYLFLISDGGWRGWMGTAVAWTMAGPWRSLPAPFTNCINLLLLIMQCPSPGS